MKKYAAILLILMFSCKSEEAKEYTVEDEVVEMNWNNAVKDLYF